MHVSTRLSLAIMALTSIASLARGAQDGIDTLPFKHGRWIFYGKSLGPHRLAYYLQDGLSGKPRKLLDPDAAPGLVPYPPDDFCVSGNARYFCYVVSQTDPRFEELHVLDIDKGIPLPDVLRWTHFSDIAWVGNGFYYASYTEPTPGQSASGYVNQKVFYHRLGTPQDQDQLVYQDPAHPTQFYTFLTTFDEKTLILHISDRSTGHRGNAEYVRHGGPIDGPFTTIEPSITDGRFFLCDNIGRSLLMFTTYRAPKGRVILVDPENPSEAEWKTVVPEGNGELESADTAGGKLFLTYKVSDTDAKVLVCNLEGHVENELPVPRPSVVDLHWGRSQDRYVFVSVKYGTEPKKLFRYVVASKKLVPFP